MFQVRWALQICCRKLLLILPPLCRSLPSLLTEAGLRSTFETAIQEQKLATAPSQASCSTWLRWKSWTLVVLLIRANSEKQKKPLPLTLRCQAVTWLPEHTHQQLTPSEKPCSRISTM